MLTQYSPTQYTVQNDLTIWAKPPFFQQQQTDSTHRLGHGWSTVLEVVTKNGTRYSILKILE